MITGTILDQILEKKRVEVARRKAEETLSALETRIKGMAVPLNLAGCLMGPGVRLIAEVKRASPSRGVLKADLDAAALARIYARNGAAAISVLTEADHFRGSLKDMADVKAAVAQDGLPVLRKDFLYDPYQVTEARAYGADAILLIVAMLQPSLLKELLAAARSYWLQALVEVHSEAEMRSALDAGAEIIGVNHRDLKTFQMDMTLAERLRPLAPRGKVFVAESGINSHEDVLRMARAGVNAILVGEALVTAPDIAAKVKELSGVV